MTPHATDTLRLVSSEIELAFLKQPIGGKNFVSWVEESELLVELDVPEIWLGLLRLGRLPGGQLRTVIDELISRWKPGYDSKQGRWVIARLRMLKVLLERYGPLAEPPWHTGDIAGVDGESWPALIRTDCIQHEDRVWRSNGYSLAVVLYYSERVGVIEPEKADQIAASEGPWLLDSSTATAVLKVVQGLMDGSLGYEVLANEVWGLRESINEEWTYQELLRTLDPH